MNYLVDARTERWYSAGAMETPERDCLHAAIGDFLHDCRADARMRLCRGFWRERPRITAEEIHALAHRGRRPLCVDALARALGRDRCDIEQLLDALLSVGLLERHDGGYAPTAAMLLYAQAVRDGRLPGPESASA